MKSLRLILGFVGLLGSMLVAHAQFAWTGLGPDQDITTPGNWQGGITPPLDGTDNLTFGKAINNTVYLSSDTLVNSLTLTAGDDYRFQSAGVVLRISNNSGYGIYGTVGGSNSRMVFDSSISVAANGGGTLRMDAGDNTLAFTGDIVDDGVGVTNVVLTNANGGTMGAFVFNDLGTGSTYTGNTTITGVPGQPVTVAFWNDQPFGVGGTLFIQNAAQLIAHGNRDVDTDFQISTTDTISFKSWDAVVCYDGATTLAANAIIAAQRGTQGVPSSDNSGVYPMPGPMTRYAIDFRGAFGETGGARSLTVNGQGVVVLESVNNTYTGGTTVGGGGANGALVFGYAGSVPTTGTVTANANGYVGLADPTVGAFTTFLTGAFNRAGSTGSVGIDTLPSQSINTFNDPINLTGANANLRIGTATSAILTGLITPQGATYKFGNGGGTLFVQSALTGARGVLMNNGSVVPLTLYLQENTLPTANNYSTGTTAVNGFIIFDGSYALPGGANSLVATTAGGSYIGYTDLAGINGTALANGSAFLSLFNAGTTNGIIGFDTHAGNGTVNIADNIDLSTFNTGVYLGTATSAELSGTLSPASDNVLRLTAAQGGFLQVDGPLSGTMSLSLGTTSPNDIYSSGTVFLPNANTYSGGTTINSTAGGLTLMVGDNSSLGSGALNLPQGVIAGLKASTGNVILTNPIVFASGASPAQLFISGGSGLELDGPISGPGSISVMDPSFTFLNLGGNNTFTGDINLYNASLQLFNDNAAGMGTVRFLNNSTLGIYTAAPVLYGISGENGSIILSDLQTLTIDISNSLNSHEFGGTIGYETPPNASLTVTSSTGGDALYLYGNNNYSGGTSIINNGAVALGNDNALGSGPVTLNTTMAGALAVNVGITFSNPLVYQGGTLQGFGTFAPSTVNGVAGNPIIFDTGKGVVPGIYGLGTKGNPGTLTITNGVEFASGGAMLWSIQDGARTDGFSTLVVNGTTPGILNISANPGGQFNLFLASLDSTGAPGAASNLTLGSNNQFLIAQVTGIGGTLTWDGVQGDFNVDTSLFATPVSSVFLSQVGNDLFINFTPVPEPSTYALIGLGLGAVLFPALRRRKRV